MSSGPLRSSTQLDLLQLPFRKAKLVLVASHCYSVTTSCLTLCDPMDCSLPGFPVLHYLLELAQTHVYCGEGNGTPLQYSCLENPMDGGAWWAAVHGVAKSWTRVSEFTFTFHFHFSLSCIGEGNGNPLQCSCLPSLTYPSSSPFCLLPSLPSAPQPPENTNFSLLSGKY